MTPYSAAVAMRRFSAAGRARLGFLARLVVTACLALILVGATQGAVAGAVPSGWARAVYPGASAPGGTGQTARIPSYSLAYPPGWTARHWPDSLAGYGQLDLWSPTGTTIDLLVLPLRPHGPTVTGLIAHDADFLSVTRRDRVRLPFGVAIRLAGTARDTGSASQFLYLRGGDLLYRFFASWPTGAAAPSLLTQVARSLHVPALSAIPPASPPGTVPGSLCCHCPAWGAGWGTVLTRLDGVPVYSNGGNVDNGCNGASGILYQCVELVQRYFTVRWGYPAIWSGVDAAADMRSHHPAGIVFIPNGGTPAPRVGDALLFQGGAFGHVALVQHLDKRAGTIDLVEENWSPSGAAHLPLYAGNTIAVRNSAYGSYVVAGWLHSLRNVASGG